MRSPGGPLAGGNVEDTCTVLGLVPRETTSDDPDAPGDLLTRRLVVDLGLLHGTTCR